MQRRIRIIMDHEHNINPDLKTNWVVSRDYDIVWAIEDVVGYHRDTLVIQP